MIANAAFAACFVTLFVTLILPVLILVLLARKHPGEKLCSAWFLGAAGFFVPQILIRLPLMNLLAASEGFLTFSQEHFFLYCLSLAFTAGLFELFGRFATAKLLQRKDLPFSRALAAGLGHGGIETMLLVGLTYVNNIVCLFLIRSGSFDALIAQTEAMGADVSQLLAVKDALVNTHPAMFLLAGLERMLTMVCHAGLSVLVCYGVQAKRTVQCLLLCLLLHTLLDMTPSFTGIFPLTTAYILIYVCIAAMAALSLFLLRRLSRRWPACQKGALYDA